MRIVVVLPEPFGPRKPTISPRRTCIETSSTTVRSPKRLVRWRTSMTVSGIAAHSAERDIDDLPGPQAAARPSAGRASTR